MDVKSVKKIMPLNHSLDVYEGLAHSSWSKRSGHAGSKMIDRSIEKAKALGFVEGGFSHHGTPDGSVMGTGSVYSHPAGWEMKTSRSYGNTAYDNSFSISLRQIAVA